MNKRLIASAFIVVAPAIATPASAGDAVYGKFPVTLKSWMGNETNSVAYTGQIARQVLHDSLKKLAGKGNGKPNAALQAEMMLYFEGKGKNRKILAPTSKGPFVIKQKTVGEISNPNLAGKTYKGTVSGMPNNMTGPELIKFWIGKAASANKGVDIANGYNYPQLISKFILGAVFYHQAVDNYLDEKMTAGNKPNNKPYKKGKHYTGKEHSWDEAFGYFGFPAHGLMLSPSQLYDIAKRKPTAVSIADANSDGKIDLYNEMVFGPAYYAAGSDKSKKTAYAKTIGKAFLDGRKLIASADGNALNSSQLGQIAQYARVIEENWEKTLAEATFKYAGSCFKDLQAIKANPSDAKVLAKYIKHWGELKGFSLAMQTGRKNLGDTATRLNRLIGFGPVMPNSSQVIDIDSGGNYVKDQASGINEYMGHMLKVQKLIVDKYGIKARKNDQLAGMSDMLKKLGSGSTAEND